MIVGGGDVVVVDGVLLQGPLHLGNLGGDGLNGGLGRSRLQLPLLGMQRPGEMINIYLLWEKKLPIS